MKKLILIPLILVICSCSTFVRSTSAELLVQYATIKFVNNYSSPVARATRVIELASTAKTFFDNDTLPIVEIETLIRQKIDWSELDAADAMLANALIQRVADEVKLGGVSEDRRVSGSTVLGWIIDGARLAGG